MGLKETYDTWTFKPLAGTGNADTPRNQSEGKVNVDYLPNTYQNGLTNRTPKDKVVTQATADNATNGKFNSAALGYYSTLIDSPLKLFKSQEVHKYKIDRNYTTQFENSKGVLYSTNS
jgi:hypothetical protein